MTADEERAYQRRYERTGMDPDGLYGPQACRMAGHVPGCPGKAGGDHELLDAAKRKGVANLAEYVGNYNKAQDAFEWAVRELVRVRVNHQFDSGTHWTQR